MDKDDLAQERTDWAEDRTDWAEDRTRLAAERTFAGWVRTGLTAIVVALGLQAVFRPFEPTWMPKAVATAFLLTALVIFVAGWQEARRSCRAIDTHSADAQPLRRISVLSALLAVGTVGIGAVLWLL